MTLNHDRYQKDLADLGEVDTSEGLKTIAKANIEGMILQEVFTAKLQQIRQEFCKSVNITEEEFKNLYTDWVVTREFSGAMFSELPLPNFDETVKRYHFVDELIDNIHLQLG